MDQINLNVGDEFDVVIEGHGSTGDPFCKLQNYVVFVKESPDLKVGDACKIRLTKVTTRVGFSEVVKNV